MHLFLKFILGMELYIFRTVLLSIKIFSRHTGSGMEQQFLPDPARKLSSNLYDI